MNFNFNFTLNMNSLRIRYAGKFIAWAQNMLNRTAEEARESAEAKAAAITALAKSRLHDIEVASHAEDVVNSVAGALEGKVLKS